MKTDLRTLLLKRCQNIKKFAQVAGQSATPPNPQPPKVESVANTIDQTKEEKEKSETQEQKSIFSDSENVTGAIITTAASVLAFSGLSVYFSQSSFAYEHFTEEERNAIFYRNLMFGALTGLLIGLPLSYILAYFSFFKSAGDADRQLKSEMKEAPPSTPSTPGQSRTSRAQQQISGETKKTEENVGGGVAGGGEESNSSIGSDESITGSLLDWLWGEDKKTGKGQFTTVGYLAYLLSTTATSAYAINWALRRWYSQARFDPEFRRNLATVDSILRSFLTNYPERAETIRSGTLASGVYIQRVAAEAATFRNRFGELQRLVQQYESIPETDAANKFRALEDLRQAAENFSRDFSTQQNNNGFLINGRPIVIDAVRLSNDIIRQINNAAGATIDISFNNQQGGQAGGAPNNPPRFGNDLASIRRELANALGNITAGIRQAANRRMLYGRAADDLRNVVNGLTSSHPNPPQYASLANAGIDQSIRDHLNRMINTLSGQPQGQLPVQEHIDAITASLGETINTIDRLIQLENNINRYNSTRDLAEKNQLRDAIANDLSQLSRVSTDNPLSPLIDHINNRFSQSPRSGFPSNLRIRTQADPAVFDGFSVLNSRMNELRTVMEEVRQAAEAVNRFSSPTERGAASQRLHNAIERSNTLAREIVAQIDSIRSNPDIHLAFEPQNIRILDNLRRIYDEYRSVSTHDLDTLLAHGITIDNNGRIRVQLDNDTIERFRRENRNPDEIVRRLEEAYNAHRPASRSSPVNPRRSGFWGRFFKYSGGGAAGSVLAVLLGEEVEKGINKIVNIFLPSKKDQTNKDQGNH